MTKWIPEKSFRLFRGGGVPAEFPRQRVFDTYDEANDYAEKLARQIGERVYIVEYKGSYAPEKKEGAEVNGQA